MNVATLTQLALLGTGRSALPEVSGETPLAAMAAGLDRADTESALLGMVALSSLHSSAGVLPQRDLQPAPAAAGVESCARAGAAAAGYLSGFLGGENAELLPEWLRLCAEAGCVVPPEFLPALLAWRPSHEELRALKLPVLGERGRWIAQSLPAWAWVTGAVAEDETAWETGEPAARLALLRRVRMSDPARARELLAATWKDETPDDREAFAASIAGNPQPEDEPFLTACLEDKRKDVRRTAFETLSRLPGSGFSRRMRERVEPLLHFTPAEAGSLLKLRKGKPATLEVTLPDACDKPMQRDGVEAKPPRGTGEKTWWLIQMLQAAPLGGWEEKWQTPPADLIAAAQAAESGKDILQAWQKAACIQRNAAWAEALLHSGLVVAPGELLALLPDAAREHWYTTSLAAATPEAGVGLLQQLISDAGSPPFSQEFSHTVLGALRSLCVTRFNYSDYTLRSQLRLLAIRLHPDALSAAQTGWPVVPGEAWTFWKDGVEQLLQLCHIRSEMRASLISGKR